MAWQRVILLLFYLMPTCLVQHAWGERVDCLWNQLLVSDHNVTVVCQMHQPSSLGCGVQSLQLIIDEQPVLPHDWTDGTAHFTVSVVPKGMQHIHCELRCLSLAQKDCAITVKGGYPPSPLSPPKCHIPSDDSDIYCQWSPGRDPLIPTSYTLYWEPSNVGYVVGTRTSGVISRNYYVSYKDLTVWVTAKNQLGSEQSKASVFNTGDIIKPVAPTITHHHHHGDQPLEIYWELECDFLGPSDRSCEVQYRVQNDPSWTKGGEEYQGSFLLDRPRPITEYEFQVRCNCGGTEAIMSDWSSIHTAKSAEAAPVGVLDVWSDCGSSTCDILWKELPRSLARGIVQGYVVTVKHGDGTLEERNVSVSELDGARKASQFDRGSGGQHYRHTLAVVGPARVHVSAYTSQGATDPASLALPRPGQMAPEMLLTVKGSQQSLNVSWVLPSHLSESVQEYVVQHQLVGRPHSGWLDWIKVNKTQSSVMLTGHLMNCTAYNVSLFAVLNNSSWTLLKSAIAYTHQGVPPIVPEFQIQQISDYYVNLTWKHIPLNESMGIILEYLLGLGNHTGRNREGIHNVSSDQNSFQLSDLQPGQRYQVWIRAVTEAGQGPKETRSFSTTAGSGYAVYLIVASAGIFILGLIITFPYLSLRKDTCFLMPVWCYDKVPDPMNSRLFKQFHHSWTGLCSPSESTLKISQLEVVVTQVPEDQICLCNDGLTEALSEEEEEEHQQLQTEKGEEHKEGREREEDEDLVLRETGGRCRGGEDYSQMIDTEEEDSNGGGMDESWDSMEKEKFCSDYERHFMPSAIET